MECDVRILSSRTHWWVLAGSKVAWLPLEAVLPVGAYGSSPPGDASPSVVDREQGLRLAEGAVRSLVQAGFFADPPHDNYAVTVLTATACNLGCNYCFQNTAMAPLGSFAPPRIEGAVLDRELVDASVSFISRQVRRYNMSSVTLLLFGGEPLLNPPGCLRLLTGLRSLNLVDAEIVTNGVLLTPALTRSLVDAGLRRIQVTFDGDRESHDGVRVTRNGRPTYEAILRNVRASNAASPGLSWNFRVNVSHHNVKALSALLVDLGAAVSNARQITLHLALIDDNGLGYENAVGYDPVLAETFVALHQQAIRAGMRVPPSKPLTACPYCSVVGGARGAVINADGRLYSCWENAGRDGWDIGDVRNGYAERDVVDSRWVACDFDIKPHATRGATRRFFDLVDAAALDEQLDRGELAQANASM